MTEGDKFYEEESRAGKRSSGNRKQEGHSKGKTVRIEAQGFQGNGRAEDSEVRPEQRIMSTMHVPSLQAVSPQLSHRH